jgi:hypothetical protein
MCAALLSSCATTKATDSFCGWAKPIVISSYELDALAKNHPEIFADIVNYDSHYKNLCDRE